MNKVCYVNPTVLLKRPIAEIIENLEEGHSPGLLIPRRAFSKPDDSSHYSMVQKAKVLTYPTINPFSKIEQPIPITPSFFRQAHKILKEYDIIHMWVPYYLTSAWIMLYKRLFFPRKRLILTMDTVPGYSFSMGSIDFLFRMWNKAFRWLIFGTPRTITLYGKSLAKHAIAAGAKEGRIRVIPTGIDTSKFSGRQRKGIRKEFNISPKTKVILYVGLLIPRKGIDIIIRTASQLRRLDIKFLIVGDGPYRKRYEKMAREFGLQNKVLFTGTRRDVADFYNSADLFFFPSRGEGLPGVVMEAMASGLPCIASNIPCIPDLIEHEKNGFLCRMDDVLEFVKAISRLIKDDALRKAVGDQAKKRMVNLEWKSVVKMYEEIYKD